MQQLLTLFDPPPAGPQGFSYYPDFITTSQEEQLLQAIGQLDLHPMLFQGYTAKRKVASFGFDFNFSTRQLAKGRPIPDSFHWLLDEVAHHMAIDKAAIAELLVTEYPPGALINWHRDAPPFDRIAGISLLSDCTFRLRPYERAGRSRRSTISYPVRRRSLYTIEGPARSDWEHSTAAVTATRYSTTVRTLAE